MGLCITASITLISFTLSLNREEWILPFGCGTDINDNNINFYTNAILTPIFGVLCMIMLVIYANMLAFIFGHCKLFQEYLLAIMDCQDANPLQNIQNQNQDSNTFQILKKENNVIDWERFKMKLRKLIPYHVSIYEAGADVENVSNMMVLVWFGGFSICSCLVLYHITTINILSLQGLRDVWMLLTINITLIIISFWGEQIITESEKIASVCYEVDFVGADIRIQKSFLLIMTRARKPIVLTIGKLKVLNLNTMLGILQSTYSYYTILRNLTKE